MRSLIPRAKRCQTSPANNTAHFLYGKLLSFLRGVTVRSAAYGYPSLRYHFACMTNKHI
jgi:hypothetical protein